MPGQVRGAGAPPHLGTTRRGGSQGWVGAPRKPLAGTHQAGLSCEARWVLCFENILKTLGYPNNVSKTFLFVLKRWKDSFLSELRGPGSRGQEGSPAPVPSKTVSVHITSDMHRDHITRPDLPGLFLPQWISSPVLTSVTRRAGLG